MTQRVNNHLSENPIATKVQQLCTEPFSFRVGRNTKKLSVRAGSSLHSDIRPLKKKTRSKSFSWNVFPFYSIISMDCSVCQQPYSTLSSGLLWHCCSGCCWCRDNNDGSAKLFCCVDYSIDSSIGDTMKLSDGWRDSARGPSHHSNPALNQTSKLFLPSCTLSAK